MLELEFAFYMFVGFKWFHAHMVQVGRKIALIYGGGNMGLMGLVSRAVHDGDCHVLG